VIAAIFDTAIAAPASTPAFTRPVAFVKTKAEGVPRAGVIRVGEVPNTKSPEPVSSEHNVANSAEVDDVIPVIGSPVQFVRTPDVGVPKSGVTKVGEVLKTRRLDPVSSDISVASSADVDEINCVSAISAEALISAATIESRL